MFTNRADLHRLTRIIKNAISRLESVRTAITATGNATVEAIGKNTEAAKTAAEKNPPEPLSRITVDVQIPREETDRYYAEQNKSHRLQWGIFWATVATFGAVFAYAVITLMQWRTMDATFKTAQEALGLSREQFRRDQRPYVWLTNNGLGSPELVLNRRLAPPSGQILWTFHYTDYGKSPAYHVLTHKLIRVGIGQPFRECYGFSSTPRGAGTPVPPNKDDFGTLVSDPGITPEQYDRLIGTDDAISIQVRIEYTDAYGCKYESNICLERLAVGSIQYCPDGNGISECTEVKKK